MKTRAAASTEGSYEEAMASTEGLKEDVWDISDIFEQVLEPA